MHLLHEFFISDINHVSKNVVDFYANVVDELYSKNQISGVQKSISIPFFTKVSINDISNVVDFLYKVVNGGPKMNIGKENEYTEFKRSTSETKEAINAIAAMLNKHNKGKVSFGVKNNGDVIGQDIRPETLNELSRDITINIKPSFLFTVEEKTDGDGIHYIEVTFSGTRTPYSAYNRYYLRFHDENRIMDNEMLHDYYRLSSNDYSQWEKMSSNIDLNSIDNVQLESFIDHGKQNGRVKYDTDNRITLLSRLGLLYNDQYLNNAGNVLFGSYSPVMVGVATFASNSRLTVLDQNVFEGNIFRCVEDVMTCIRKNISWRYEFTGSSHRLEVPEIPIAALREIVVNAFAHGEYQSTTDLEVTIFKNRISIYSPGHFPAQYTPEDFSSGKLEPIPMNPTITNILNIDGLIEKLSTGFERVFEYFVQHKSNIATKTQIMDSVLISCVLQFPLRL